MQSKRYALVDAAVHPDAAASYRHHTGGVECAALLPPGLSRSGAERGAWLMRIDHPGPAQAWLRQLQATDAHGISVLVSPRAFDVVMMHLQMQLRLRSNEGGPGLLRFHDPRVLAHLHHFIAPERMEELFAPFSEWRTCDGDYLHAGAMA